MRLIVAATLLLVSAQSSQIVDEFRDSTNQLIKFTVRDVLNSGLKWLEPLVDDFGDRMICEQSLENAIDYVVENLRKDGFDNVHTESVPGLPHWKRGDDRVRVVAPRELPLQILAIAGINPINVTADAVVLNTLEELETADVNGKIVVFAQKWRGYFDDLVYRRSSKLVKERGAVGLLVKSIGPFSIGSPHTGSGTDEHLPAASLSLEEAELLRRWAARNKTIRLEMDIRSKMLGKCESRNIVFDLKGTERPDEIILISGHIDSWDLGQGAMDDGGGIAAVWQAMKALQALGRKDERFRPKRTIRAVFWTAEEQGFYGAHKYYEDHRNGSEKFVFVSETDQGAFRPKTNESFFRFRGNETHRRRLLEIVELLNLNGIPLSLRDDPTGKQQGDVQKWADDGVASLNYVAEKGIDYYFYFHHTHGDYLNIFEEGDIDFTAAIMAVLGHVLGNQQSWE